MYGTEKYIQYLIINYNGEEPFAVHLKLTQYYKPTILQLKKKIQDFPGGPVVKNLPANAGVTGSFPGLGRSHMPQGN